MKKYIIVLLALLIFSCDEDNLVKDDRVDKEEKEDSLKTNNEGWIRQEDYIITNKDVLLYNIAVFENNILGIGGMIHPGDYWDMIYSSPDKGKTWNAKNSSNEFLGYFYPTYYFYKDLIVTVGGNLNWSKDAGNTWNSNPLPEDPDHRTEMSLYFSKVNNNCAYLLTNYALYKSTNSDYHTWIKINSSLNYDTLDHSKRKITTTDIRYINFVTELKGFFIDAKKKQIVITEDGCKTFNRYDIELDERSVYQLDQTYCHFNNFIQFFGDNLVYFLKSDGLYKSNNFGKTWTKIYQFNFEFRDRIQVIDENTIFVKQYIFDNKYDYNDIYNLYGSTDGGISFTKQEFPDSIKIKDFYFTDKNNGLAVGSNREILKTTSGGFKDN